MKNAVSKAASTMAKHKAASSGPPTKEEVRAARKIMHRYYRSNRRVHRRLRVVPAAERDFRTWEHDFRVVMAAAATGTETPEGIVEDAARAADLMAVSVEQRRPPVGADAMMRGVHYRRGVGAHARWHAWQETFDSLVHELAKTGRFSAVSVVTRATEIADLARKVLDKRRPKSMRRA